MGRLPPALDGHVLVLLSQVLGAEDVTVWEGGVPGLKHVRAEGQPKSGLLGTPVPKVRVHWA